MIGAGTFINPLLKVITVVAILAAVSIFVVKPILDTTEHEAERIGNGIEAAQSESAERSRQLDLQSSRSRAVSYAQGLRAGSQPWDAAADEVLRCVREAGDSAARMNHCEQFAEIVTTETLSDRNFATSYADSLEIQGKAAEAKRVRDCVDRAGYRPAPMQRCNDLADQLLFG
jgi:hypothetical protein